MGTVEGKKNSQEFNFKQNLFHKRKIALECKFQSNFVYSLNILDYMHFETIFFMTGHIVKRIEEMLKTNISI